MGFVTDKQTLDDLNILGRYKNNSIFSLFNHTITGGGGRLLEKMFHEPLNDIDEINKRTEIFSFFQKIKVSLPFDEKQFEILENYIRNPESKNRIIAGFNISRAKMMNFIANEKEYLVLKEGLLTTINLMDNLKEVVEKIVKESQGNAYHEKVKRIYDILSDKRFDLAYECNGQFPFLFRNVFKLDYIFRAQLNEKLENLLKAIYELDVYIAVSNVSRERKFTYAKALAQEDKVIDMQGGYHPCIPKAVDNDIRIDSKQKNVFFLTGANMAGKSTFMKSFSIAIYLAHMGFPVAAKEMVFSLHDGIYTSINVPDNLSMGYSHFYAEVLRVKHVAEEVASNKQLVIIFDELFKGTNVKDAYDGTVSIVDAFSKRNGSFIISTHIMEAGQTLKKSNDRLFFKYLPTVMKGTVPTYPYKLEDGITDDRHGMIIIKNEKILDIISTD